MSCCVDIPGGGIMFCCVDIPGGGIIFPLPASCFHQEIRNYIWDKLRTWKTLYSTYCTLKWTKSRDDRLFFCFLLCSKATLLEGLCPFPLPQARAASPIRTTSGNLLSNMYSTPSGNLSFLRSGKWVLWQRNRKHLVSCGARSHSHRFWLLPLYQLYYWIRYNNTKNRATQKNFFPK